MTSSALSSRLQKAWAVEVLRGIPSRYGAAVVLLRNALSYSAVASLVMPAPFWRPGRVFNHSTREQEVVGDIDWSTVGFSARTAKRNMKRQRVWAVGVCFKLSLPLLLSCLMTGIIYVHMRDTTMSAHKESLVSHAFSGRAVSCEGSHATEPAPLQVVRHACTLPPELIMACHCACLSLCWWVGSWRCTTCGFACCWP